MYVSIVICTYNRSELLKDCLDSLLKMDPVAFEWELLVVDNNSSDNTKNVVLAVSKQFENLRYVFESNQGLSTARNTGAKNSKAAWILYHDDDAIAHKDMLIQFHQAVENFPNASCIGGKYLAWFKSNRPHWWPDGWGEMTDPRSDCGPISVASLSGGIFAIKKSALASVGFFDPKLGQHGNILRYGEEVQVQARLLAEKKVLIYNPDMLIDHLVADIKHKISWHLKAAYTHGINFWSSQELKRPKFYRSKLNLLKILPRAILVTLNGFLRLLTEKNYYWQNWLYDSLAEPIFETGKFYSKE